MNLRNAAGVVLLSIAVVACGGGGGSGGGSPPPATGGGGTTPPPPPAPPPPPPPPTYSTFAQLTGTQTFKTTCAGSTNVNTTVQSITAAPFGRGVTIVSDRAVPTYDISSDGAGLLGPFQVSFTQADRDSAITSSEAYRKTNPTGPSSLFSTFTPLLAGSTYQYAKFAQIVTPVQNNLTSLFCAYGVPTLLTDRPATSVTYSSNLVAGTLVVIENVGAGPRSDYAISSSATTLSANPTTGQINVTVNLKGRLRTGSTTSTDVTDFGTYTGQVTIDGTTQSYDGLLSDPSGAVVGTFGGWFFGPQGREAAFSFNVQQRRSNNSDVVAGAVTFLVPPS